jgi:hypothetical protein
MAIDLTELEWAINDVTLPNANGPNKIEPVAGLKTSGVDWEQLLNAEELNWMFYKLYKAIEDLDSRTIVAGQLPIGSVYTNKTDSRNPGVILGYGTWTSLAGLTLIGAGNYTDSRGEARTFTAGNVHGTYKHPLTTSELPSHTHFPAGTYNRIGGNQGPDWSSGDNDGVNVTEGGAGGNQPHENMQPSLVCYMWERTA